MYESSIARHFAERGIKEGRMLVVLDVISERFGFKQRRATQTNT